MVDTSGQIVSQSRYLPFGELLWEDGTSPTDYTYTGQRSLSDIGLMDYNARFYDPMLGRFISADTIVPYPISSISYNRYAYIANNPMIYTDSGAWIPDGGLGGNCMFNASTQGKDIDQQLADFGITVDGNDKQKQDVLVAAKYDARKLALEAGNFASGQDTFLKTHGNINVIFGATKDIDGETFVGNCIYNHGTLSCKNDLTMTNAIHEFGHAFDFTNANAAGYKPSDYVPWEFYSSDDGYLCEDFECIAHPITMDGNWEGNYTTESIRRMEDFANMYQNWILSKDINYPYSGFDSSYIGELRQKFMDGDTKYYPNYGIWNWMKDNLKSD